jgi:uncharacterized membrane protein
MAFCGNCGTQVQDGVKFCPGCGQAIPAAAPPAQQAPQQPAQPQANYARQAAPVQQQGYQPPVIPGAPQQADIQDAQNNKTMSILAYILFFIPLLTGAHKTSAFAKYHTNQGTVLFLFSLGISIIFGILSATITAIFTATYAWGALLAIASIFGIIWLIYGLCVAALCVVGIINAAQGRMKPLPLIGRITIIK